MKIILVLITLCFTTLCVVAQSATDSIPTKLLADSLNGTITVKNNLEDSTSKKYGDVLKRMAGYNKVLDISSSPVIFINQEKIKKNEDVIFYLLSTILLLFGILKVFYSKYFYDIFRVFFNTSLRQNQLTDLLLQAKLPSLIFNIFFIISGGMYIWVLLNHYHLLKAGNNYIILTSCVLGLGAVYLGKFSSLKFIGWFTGMLDQSDVYIFITFLINKITGVILLPFIIIMIFGSQAWANATIIISLFIIGLLFILRYFRSYGLLQNQLKVNWFQFLIYITGVEIIPVLIIYKVAVKLLI